MSFLTGGVEGGVGRGLTLFGDEFVVAPSFFSSFASAALAESSGKNGRNGGLEDSLESFSASESFLSVTFLSDPSSTLVSSFLFSLFSGLDSVVSFSFVSTFKLSLLSSSLVFSLESALFSVSTFSFFASAVPFSLTSFLESSLLSLFTAGLSSTSSFLISLSSIGLDLKQMQH